jgi:hypothetical protein
MKKKKAHHLRITTISELMDAITTENHDRLARDLVVWVRMSAAAKAVMPGVRQDAFIWADDGEHRCTAIHLSTL